MFYNNSGIRFGNIRDGLSNTLIVGERASDLGFSTWVGVVHGVEHPIIRVVGSTERAPNQPNAKFADFSSHHPSGTHFIFGDGSVRTIRREVDASLFFGLGTRDGGEPCLLR